MTNRKDQRSQYLCPKCGSNDLAAEAVEHTTAYTTPDAHVHDERGGHTDLESFRCPDCNHQGQAEDELDHAVRSLAGAGAVVGARLGRAEESMYYAVLDALQALREDTENG